MSDTERLQSDLAFYLDQIRQIPLLSAEEEKELARRIQDEGDSEAREELIRSNLRLVVNIAKRFTGRGLALTDLIEEGNLGLMSAANGFDPRRGTRFSTYATPWIEKAIRRALINTGSTVRVPVYMVDLIARWKKASQDLTERLGRPPMDEELAEELAISLKKVGLIRRVVRAGQRPSQEDEDERIQHHMRRQKTSGPEEEVLDRDELGTLRSLLELIDDREAHILRLRFGIGGEQPLTLAEIGEQLNLTRERVRQIQAAALNKLNKRLSSENPLSPLHEFASQRPRANEHRGS